MRPDDRRILTDSEIEPIRTFAPGDGALDDGHDSLLT